MGEVCRTRGRDEKFIQFFFFCSKNLKGRDVGIDGKIILEWISEK